MFNIIGSCPYDEWKGWEVKRGNGLRGDPSIQTKCLSGEEDMSTTTTTTIKTTTSTTTSTTSSTPTSTTSSTTTSTTTTSTTTTPTTTTTKQEITCGIYGEECDTSSDCCPGLICQFMGGSMGGVYVCIGQMITTGGA